MHTRWFYLGWMYLPIVFGRPGCRWFIYLKDLITLVCMPFWLKSQNGLKDQHLSFLIHWVVSLVECWVVTLAIAPLTTVVSCTKGG